MRNKAEEFDSPGLGVIGKRRDEPPRVDLRWSELIVGTERKDTLDENDVLLLFRDGDI